MELLTAQQAAVTWLRQAIARGELAPGDRVGQDAVAAQIGVSLIPVREALRALESEGLVTYVARKGYAVTELDYADLEEIYHLRALLERDAVERGLPLATDDDIDELEEAAAICRDAAVEGDVDHRAGGQPALPLPALRPGRIGAAAPADPAALGRHRGVPRDLLRHARRRGRGGPRAPRDRRGGQGA